LVFLFQKRKNITRKKEKLKILPLARHHACMGGREFRCPPVLHNKKHIKTCMKKIENSMDRGCNDIYSCKVWI